MHPARRCVVRTILAGAACAGALCAAPAAADERIQTEATIAGSTVLPAVYRPARTTNGPVLRGPGCPITSLTRFRAPRPGFTQDLDFDNPQSGQQVTLQQGFIEGEIAVVSFQIPDDEFPIKLELVQAILGTVSTQPTTTRYTIMLWDGTPSTGTLIDIAISDSDDPASPPDLVLPGGPGGSSAVVGDIRFSVDSMGDPSLDWIVPAAGTPGAMHTVSVGIRIDQHNAQTGDGCGFGDLPANSNVFPCTEPATCCTPPSLLTFPNDNWLFIQTCAGGCPAGWKRFSELTAGSCVLGFCTGCRPAGDWAIRFQYSSQSCPPGPTGQCCVPSGSCLLRTQVECTGLSGVWNENGACLPNPCPAPTGACCVDGACFTVTQAQCTGAYQGNGTTCEGFSCPTPTGACCFGTACQVLNSADCAGFQGVYIGNAIACGPSSVCPLGACCLPSGACVASQSQPQCTATGGSFQGVGVACEPNNCPQPTGACCNVNTGFCGTLTQASCNGIQNTQWQGPLTTCTPTNPCIQTGACCNGTTCTVTASNACAGAYQGTGTVCGLSGNPTTCCPANFNQLGGVTVQDVFDFLTAYFQGDPSADFNQLGGVTVQDIFDFLSAYFVGCPA